MQYLYEVWVHSFYDDIFKMVDMSVTRYESSNEPNWGLFNKHGSTLIPAWIINYIHHKMWDVITDPFLNFNGWSLGMDK